MGNTFNPEKYDMVFCPLCNGKGKLPKNPDEFDVCRRCGGFGLIRKEGKTFDRKGKPISTPFQVDSRVVEE